MAIGLSPRAASQCASNRIKPWLFTFLGSRDVQLTFHVIIYGVPVQKSLIFDFVRRS